jgi:protein-tyrosine phosphatase
MVDLHAHVLAGIDDGPATEREALAVARAAAAAGTRVLVATPHVNARFDPSPGEVAERANALAALLAAENVALEIATGAEIAHQRLDDLDDDRLRRHSLGGGGVVLLECDPPASRDIESDVASLRARGFGVLLAHAERCRIFRQDPGAIGRLVEGGAHVSVTAASFEGAFGEPARRFAFALLETGLVHDIASDAHDVRARPPDLRAGVRAIRRRLRGTEPWIRRLTDDGPAALLAGTPLPPPPMAPPERRSPLGQFLAR